MDTASVCVLRESISCLLPLKQAFQYQQVCLTKAPFRLLPLYWDLEYVRFCMCPLSSVSVSHSPLALLYTSPIGLHSHMFWGPLFSVQDLRAGEPDVEFEPLTPWGEPHQL